MPSHHKNILLSGGGTGGHIFPAIAIANALKEMVPGASFLFVGAKGRMEMEKVPRAGYPIKGIWISGFQRKMTVKNLLFPLKVIISLVSVNRILNRFKPDVVIGTGGYASGPALKMAVRKHIPTLILEQNSYPGVTNRLLAKHVDCICVAYPGMERFFPAKKMVFTGNPVRQDIAGNVEKKEALEYFGLVPGRATLLIIGGSQGALSINQAVTSQLTTFDREDIQLIWQTGAGFYRQALAIIEQLSAKHIHVFDFIERMDLAYAASDVVISRAGAIAISELCLTGKPSILVPLPHAAEDHQTKNAMALVEKKAACMLRDEHLGQLSDKAIELIKDKEKQLRLSQQIGAMGRPEAVKRIAEEVIRLMERK